MTRLNVGHATNKFQLEELVEIINERLASRDFELAVDWVKSMPRFSIWHRESDSRWPASPRLSKVQALFWLAGFEAWQQGVDGSEPTFDHIIKRCGARRVSR